MTTNGSERLGEELKGHQVTGGARGGRAWRLTSYFALLVAVMAVAAAAALVYVFVQTDRDSRAAALKDATFSAQAAVRDLGTGVATLRATVASLAATPNIDQAALQPSCTLSFGLSGGLSRGHVDILKPDGSVACSSRPRAGKAPPKGYAGSGWLKRVRGPVLLGPVLDTATGDQSVVFATRTPAHGFVAALVALGPVGADLVRVYGGGHPVEFLVATPGGGILTRSIAATRWIGKPLAGTPFAGSHGSERRDVDGKKRFYARAVVPGAGWTLYAGEDKSAVLATGHRLRRRQLIIILAGLALVLVATLAVYRRVAVPMRRLGEQVRATSAKTPPEPVPVSGPAEVAALGEDVNGLIASVGRELLQRQRAEETAVASERSYRRLFESSPLPMWIEDAGTKAMLAVNEAAIARYGYSTDEFLALTAADLEVPEGSGAESLPGLTRHLRRDGAELKMRTIAHDISFNGRAARCVIAEDVGERELLESRLRQAQKMEAVGQLAGGVAHDFNNLLTVISGYGAMARNRIGAGPGARELDEIDRAADRAVQLTQQLLAFSRQQLREPVVLDLNEVIAAVSPMLTRLIGENIEIGVLTSVDAPPVLADRGQIEQVIVNLVVNARDAMPTGGTLTIDTRSVLLDERYAADHAGIEPGEYACLSVTDTGTGIDRETQSRIFEPFFTTKEVGAGTGLGLATVHGIVTQSGGHLEVYSEPGLGSSFKVYLPAAAGEPATRAFAPALRPESLSGTETVLVCEDDELVRVLLETILIENGYRVLAAALPKEALALTSRPDAEIDVLVSDVVMPQMSGPELVERLRGVRPALRTLFLSGYPAETLRGRSLPEDSEFLQKPFDDVSLLRRVRSLIDGVEAGKPSADERGARRTI